MNARASDAGALRSGVAIEWWSIGWMLVEAVVSLSAGAAAGSVALVAFGADSVIELISAGVLLRRLRVEQRGGCASEVQAAERRASWLVGALLFLLAAWVVGSIVHDLLTHARPESSPVGLAMAAASTVVMPWIVASKRRIAGRIGSPALRADPPAASSAPTWRGPCWPDWRCAPSSVGGGPTRWRPWASSTSLSGRVGRPSRPRGVAWMPAVATDACIDGPGKRPGWRSALPGLLPDPGSLTWSTRRARFG